MLTTLTDIWSPPVSPAAVSGRLGKSGRCRKWIFPRITLYNESAPGKGAATLARSFVKDYGKPMMIEEFGVDAHSWNIASDPYLARIPAGVVERSTRRFGRHRHVRGWQDIHQDDVYPLYAALNGILRNAGWQDGEWTPVDFVSAGGPPADLARALPNGEPFNAQLTLNSAWRLQRKLSGKLALANSLAADQASQNLINVILLGQARCRIPAPVLDYRVFWRKSEAGAARQDGLFRRRIDRASGRHGSASHQFHPRRGSHRNVSGHQPGLHHRSCSGQKSH